MNTKKPKVRFKNDLDFISNNDLKKKCIKDLMTITGYKTMNGLNQTIYNGISCDNPKVPLIKTIIEKYVKLNKEILEGVL